MGALNYALSWSLNLVIFCSWQYILRNLKLLYIKQTLFKECCKYKLFLSKFTSLQGAKVPLDSYMCNSFRSTRQIFKSCTGESLNSCQPISIFVLIGQKLLYLVGRHCVNSRLHMCGDVGGVDMHGFHHTLDPHAS